MLKRIMTLIIFLTITIGINSAQSQDILQDIEQRVDEAVAKVYSDSSFDDLAELQKQVRDLYDESPGFFTAYWLAYVRYRMALVLMQANRESDAEKVLKAGIEVLEKEEYDKSDYYALLSLMSGLNLSFSGAFSAAFGAGRVNSVTQKALRFDDNNARAYLAAATYDYYTPRTFGGGRKTEELLQKALDADFKLSENPYMPEWGLWDTYRMMILYYVNREEDMEKANKYISESLEHFPDDPYFMSLQSRISQR